jgi:hypothetical protein
MKKAFAPAATLPRTSPVPTAKPFAVGELVDVLCDHNEDGERVRGWMQGVVVQADHKLVAVQFVEDVYLTDGWMVPDRILFCQQGADNIRPSTRRRVRRVRSRRR